jgi:phenylalanyl-tRNA synthetase beta subunit
MQSVVELIQKIAGGELAGFVDVYPEPQKPVHANVTVEKINKVLGTQLTGADIADVFACLGLPYKEEVGVFEVSVPFERLDLSIPEDLVEEVARITGYDKILAVPLPPFDKQPEINKNFAAAERVREELVKEGYSEVYTSVFADKGERMVLNKVDSVRPYLRDSLLPGLTDALAKNKPNKDPLGLKEIKLFEIGTVWKDGKELVMIGTVSEKEKASEVLLGNAFQGESLDYGNLPLSVATRFEPFSKYPYVVRDIAIWVPNGTEPAGVLEILKKEAGELAHKIWLFDRFEKAGRTSLAYRLIFQSFSRTLIEEEVNQIMAKISGILLGKGFEIR